MNEALRRCTFWLLAAVVLTAVWQGEALRQVGTPARAAGLGAAALGGLSWLLYGRRYRLGPAQVALVGLAGWAFASVLWSERTGTTFSYALTLAQLTLFVVLVWEFADRPGDVERLMGALVGGCLLTALSVVTAARPAPDTVRFTANGFNENDLGTMLALAVPVAWYLFSRVGHAVVRLLCAVYVVVGSTGVLLTGSRGALAVLAVALCVVPVTWSRLPGLLRVVVVLAVVVAAVLVSDVVPHETAARLDTLPGAATSSDMTGRVPLWEASVQVIDRHPWLGVGGGAEQLDIERRTSVALLPHNTYLSVAAGLGVVGLALFALVGVLTAVGTRALPVLDRRVLLVLLLALLVGLVPLHWELQKPLWIVLALVLGAGVQPTRSVDPPSRSASPPSRHLESAHA